MTTGNKKSSNHSQKIQSPLWTSSFFAAFAGNFFLFFVFYMLLPILPMYLLYRFEISKSLMGLVLSSYTIMALLCRPFAGFMVDTFKRKKLLVISYLIFTVLFAGYILAEILIIFFIVRALHGLTYGMVTVSSNTVAIDIMPSERRGEGIGYFGIAVNIGMAVGPMTSIYMFDLMQNYYYIFAVAIFVGLLGFCSVNFIKTPQRQYTPYKTISFDRFLLIKGIPGALSLMLMTFSYGLLSTYVFIYGRDEIGIQSGIWLFFVLLSIGLIIGKLYSAKKLNKGMINRLVLIGSTILIIGFCLFIFIKNQYIFYGSAILLGIAYGFITSSFQTMMINLAPNNKRGTANATYFTSWDLGAGFGILIGGIIAEMTTYSDAFIIGLLLIIAGSVFYTLVASRYYTKHKLR